MRLRSIKVKSYADVIDTGVKRISEFGNDHLIPHFIICNSYYTKWVYADKSIFKEIFLSKIRKYGIRTAILTILLFERNRLRTLEEVKQIHSNARKTQLQKDKGKIVVVERLLGEDLDSFYSCLYQNPEGLIKAERVNIFLTQKLTGEQRTLVENRNNEYLKTFNGYKGRPIKGTRKYHSVVPIMRANIHRRSDIDPLDIDMKHIAKSSDPESIFIRNIGERWTIVLNVTLKSMQEEIRKVSHEDLSDMESKKRRLN